MRSWSLGPLGCPAQALGCSPLGSPNPVSLELAVLQPAPPELGEQSMHRHLPTQMSTLVCQTPRSLFSFIRSLYLEFNKKAGQSTTIRQRARPLCCRGCDTEGHPVFATCPRALRVLQGPSRASQPRLPGLLLPLSCPSSHTAGEYSRWYHSNSAGQGVWGLSALSKAENWSCGSENYLKNI